jgi:hypothetical protein
MTHEELGLIALRVGGALHFVQIPAMLALGAIVRQRRLAAQVPEPVQRILAVLGGGIVLLVLPGGVASSLLPATLLRTPFGVGYLATWCIFWAYRLLAQVLVYGPMVPSNSVGAHRFLTGVFVVKTSCYGLAFACLSQWVVP